MNRVKVFMLTVAILLPLGLYAADGNEKDLFNPLQYGVTSLNIVPDARGGGMANIGVANEADVYSQYWNPAKYAFAYSKAGVGVTYTPWLRQLVDDIDLVYLSGFYKLGYEQNQALAASIRYFSLGDIEMRDGGGYLQYNAKPYEMAVDLSYSLKFSENFAGAAAIRFIHSDLGVSDQEDMTPGTAFAADIAGYYNKYVMLGASECLWGLGFNLSNIGTKISYDDRVKQFLPTNLRIGTSLLYPMDDYNAISFNIDLNKLLIPTNPNNVDLTEEEKEAYWDEYYATSSIKGLFQGFSQDGISAKEKFQEITYSVGAEYSYDNQFFVRGGYYHEHENKGNRKYFSLGAGFKMTAFQLDVAYLISTTPSNPLDQTLRFSLSFDMDGLKGLVR
ncbi:type IX secretion system outer membrane channel protein PorV [Bacteroidales bacterium OttesenSCG-928-L03]|nr:type IX secretion system outer membrane channel protein PorV [Bacteroidales bacterium OttesenSCG-928-L03]